MKQKLQTMFMKVCSAPSLVFLLCLSEVLH